MHIWEEKRIWVPTVLENKYNPSKRPSLTWAVSLDTEHQLVEENTAYWMNDKFSPVQLLVLIDTGKNEWEGKVGL